MARLFKNWWKREDGRYVHLTKDGYLFVLTSVGDGCVWSVWRKNDSGWYSCSPDGRMVHRKTGECVEELERWYMTKHIVQAK